MNIMPALVSNEDTEKCLRESLKQEGYSLSPQKVHGQTGVDILATKPGESYHIEVIGFKSSPSTRAYDFYQIFFRAISRLNEGAKHCVIALPRRMGDGLPARAEQHRVAWLRIAQAFPELEVWLVDTKDRNYRRTLWREWISDP